MAKVKKNPIALSEPPAKRTVYVKTKELVKDNKTTLWRTFQVSLLGFLIFLADNGKDYIKVMIEKQKKQGEWQVKAEARHKLVIEKLDSLITLNKLSLQKPTKR